MTQFGADFLSSFFFLLFSLKQRSPELPLIFPEENTHEFLHMIKKFVHVFTNLNMYEFLLNSMQHVFSQGTNMVRKKYENAFKDNSARHNMHLFQP